ncbi:AbiH family protein [Phoenicibacter congonensis]|uniref:AbiH family protein n=1 Tax=Phoenicibacter congonensis TaxID=1944646 RepID=UPI0009A726C8|nr:AbiH family protein [Phoenicibacter congonensis]
MSNDIPNFPASAQNALKGIKSDNFLANIKPVLSDYEPIKYEPLTFKPGWHQLVVIGNGFDLECGLASGFSSFFKARAAAFKKPVKGQGLGNLVFTETIWDKVLSSMKDSNWCDIEGAIADWIAPKNKEGKRSKSKFEKTLHKLANPTGFYDTDKVEDSVALFLEKRYQHHGPWNSENLLQITREDLAKLESDFDRYLWDEVETSKGYKEKVGELMSEIILNQRPSKDKYDVEESILSFNYTRAINQFRSDEHDTEYVNIHGRLGGEIVFGIDGTDRMDNPMALPFTKTYRLMALDLPDVEKLVHVPTSGVPMADGTKMIKFYGHSLSEADYSYFQAIFDSVKLYEGDTRLVFYFRPHKLPSGCMQDENCARKEMMEKVIRLLTAYGLTLYNKDHGKNLIHKLLIEGRLSVSLLENNVRRL